MMNPVAILNRSFVLHPFLIGTFFVLRGFGRVQEYSSIASLIGTIAVLNGLLLVVFWMITKLVHNKIKAGMILSILLIPFLWYGDIQFALLQYKPDLSRYRYLLSTTAAVLILVITLLLRTRKHLEYLNQYINVVAIAFVVIEIGNILLHQNVPSNYPYLANSVVPVPAKRPVRPPDIYYIILDSYTSSASLKRYWNFDNSEFTNYLKRKEFYIARASKSNYNFTPYSLASSLNMSYLNIPQVTDGRLAVRVLPMRSLIRENRVAKILQANGYEIVNLSLFDVLQEKKLYHWRPLPDFNGLLQKHLFHKSFPGRIVEDLALNVDPGMNLRVISAVKNAAASQAPGPRFIYMHLMLPHLPYLLNRSGRMIPFQKRFGRTTFAENMAGYLEQLQFTNTLMKDVIDSIFLSSVEPPVIVIQGDHGSALLKGEDKEKESNTILNAYFLPNCPDAGLHSSISPVNSFQIVFNCYFEGKYKLFEDQAFVLDDNLNTVHKIP